MSASKTKTETDRPEGQRALSRVIKRNIHTIVNLRLDSANKRTFQEHIADRITGFSGNMGFVYLHVAWFGGWIVANSGLFGIRPFDPFPYGLLTMVVSLEAIFLSTFLLISQNRTSKENQDRADLDLQINLLTEHEITRMLQMLEGIEKKLGISDPEKEELKELENQVKPEDVLKEIERYQERSLKRNR